MCHGVVLTDYLSISLNAVLGIFLPVDNHDLALSLFKLFSRGLRRWWCGGAWEKYSGQAGGGGGRGGRIQRTVCHRELGRK